MTPLFFRCRLLGALHEPRQALHPLPWLIAEFATPNTASTLLSIGNPVTYAGFGIQNVARCLPIRNICIRFCCSRSAVPCSQNAGTPDMPHPWSVCTWMLDLMHPWCEPLGYSRVSICISRAEKVDQMGARDDASLF